jgi:hypothetical protein
MRACSVKPWIKLVAASASALACAAGAGLAAGPAAGAAATAKAPHASRMHVSPFGVGAHRAAHPRALHPAGRSTAPLASLTATTRWVSNLAPLGIAPGTSCANPGYSTISDALSAAAPGDTINVCAGTYPEQLAITQSVTLTAKGAVTVVGPVSPSSSLTSCDAAGGGQPNQDVVDICGTGPGSVSVTMTGFTIEGSWPSNVCYDSIYGVAVLGGANLSMSKSTVKDIGGNPQTDGCQGGVGIQVGLANEADITGVNSADPGTATLTNVVVTAYQKNGITVDGTGSSATITGATVTGTGPTPSIAQNGIQVSDLATAKITGGSVSGNECDVSVCGPNGFTQVQSCGILLFDAGLTTMSGTTVSANDIGVYNGEDIAWTFFAPPSSFTPVNNAGSHLGLHNRYENAYFDQGKTTLSSSTLTGGGVGIEEAQGSYQNISAVGAAKGDTITGTAAVSGNPTAAILVASDGVSGDKPVKLTATGDSFGTSNTAGVRNQSTSVLTVTGDWWGDPAGPSVWGFGTGSSVSSDVNFFPWATDSTFTTLETCTPTLSATTTGNDVVLCAKGGTGNAFLANDGSGNVLLIGNKGNDQLNGSSAGETWIIGGVGGVNTINGENGTGFIQERGNASDTLVNVGSGYTVAPH